jgi:pimeloyl-ACP methyl ester carboxylesterase
MAGRNHFLVFVPGYAGSKLRRKDTKDEVWMKLPSAIGGIFDQNDWFDLMRYPDDPNENKLEAFEIVDKVVYLPLIWEQREYSRLFEFLRDKLGYAFDFKDQESNEAKLDVYAFPYDWRQDNRLSAAQLKTSIERWQTFHPNKEVWIIAHSNGGVVARWYIEHLGGKDVAKRLFLFGSPCDGTPKVMSIATTGYGVPYKAGSLQQIIKDGLSRAAYKWLGVPEKTRELFRSFPSLYQLLPLNQRCVLLPNNDPLDHFNGEAWLTDHSKQRDYLANALNFVQSLGDKNSIETICFYGESQSTIAQGVVKMLPNKKWDIGNFEWRENADAGDGTILRDSAKHPTATLAIASTANHGNIYIDDTALANLRAQLISEDGRVSRAGIVTSDLRIQFDPEHKLSSPGQMNRCFVTVKDKDGNIIDPKKVSVTVEMIWHQELPGDDAPNKKPAPHEWKLSAVAERFEGGVIAPPVEGYYRLVARVQAQGLAPVKLEELVAVENI